MENRDIIFATCREGKTEHHRINWGILRWLNHLQVP